MNLNYNVLDVGRYAKSERNVGLPLVVQNYISDRTQKAWLTVLLIMFSFFGSIHMEAQVANYSYTNITGTYAALTTFTSISTDAALTSGTSDDGLAVITLPFTFTFNSATFTQVTMSTNGWLGMGNQAPTAAQGRTPGNMFSNALPNNLVGGFFRDGNANFTSGGSMRYGVGGTGIYTFEWNNSSGDTYNTSSSILYSYQIKLYGPASVSPGRIEVNYGPRTGTATTAGAAVGLGGINTDYYNAVTGNSTATTLVTAVPAANTLLQFAPPVIAPPACVTGFSPANLATGVVRNPVLSWSNGTGGGVATSYDVYFGTSSTPPLIGNQTTTTYSPATLSASTTYYWKVIAKNAQGSATGCGTQSFTTGTSYTYCTPTYVSGTGSGDYISKVAIAGTTLNSTSAGAASPYYTLFPQSGSTTGILTTGTAYTLTVAGGTYTTCYISAWVDLNNDGTFASSEFIGVSPNAGASTTVNFTNTFTLPSVGDYRLRLRSSDTAPGPINTEACAATNSAYGEAEDYTISATAAAPPTITSLGSSSGCAGSSITINGTNLSGATAANVKIGGTAVSSITSNSGTVIVAVIGTGTTGTVSVTTGFGTATSAASFTVNPLPTASASSNSPVCAGSTLNLTGTSNGATFSWTGPNGFTSSSQNPSITNVTSAAAGVYTFVATSAAGCTFSGTATVVVNPAPTAITVAPTTATICAGATQTLTASGANTNLTASGGNASANSTTTSYPSPLSVYYGGSKHQFIILASELTAAGYGAGSVINSLKFNVQAVATTPLTQQNFKIRIGATSASAMTTTFIATASTLVYGPVTQPAATLGINTFSFSSNFTWNGTSNIFVETTFSDNLAGVAANGVSGYVHSPGGTLSAVYYADSVTAAVVEATTTATNTFTTRPDFILGAVGTASVVWSPTTGLYTDAAATTAYTGTNLRTVYAKPAGNATYTATAAQGSCSVSATSVVTVNPNVTYYTDADGDGFGNLAAPVVSCTGAPTVSGHVAVLDSTDCNDADATKHATFPFYADADGDTYGAGTASNQCAVNAATPPAGYSVNNTDCNDSNAAIFQSALLYTDADGDGYDAGSAVTCYGASVPTGYSLTTSGSDCNDADATKHATFPFYTDADGDTYGAGTASNQCAVNATTPPAGYSVNNTDCNDSNAAIFQSALLYTDADGDGYDAGSAVTCYGASVPTGYSLTTSGSDCNDADATKHATFPFYTDADGDTYGTGTASNQCAVNATTPPAGYSVNNTDCNDADATKHATFAFYTDADGDTYGTGTASNQCAVNATTPPAGYSVNNTDCDDTNAAIFQSALLYTDADGDGYDAGSAVTCYGASVPTGYSLTTSGSDCNDADATKHAVFPFYTDADGDTYGAGTASNQCAVNATTPPAGYSVNNTDCDDTNAAIFQSALLYTDADGDGYDAGSAVTCYGASVPTGYSLTTSGSDCNDADATKHAAFPFYADADGDTYGAGTASNQCAVDATTPPAGYSVNNTDCDDTNAAIFQSALLYTDADADGYDAGSAVTCYGASVPTGYSLTTSGSDCNDADATKHAAFPFYADADGDTYGAGTASNQCAVNATTPPAGYSVNNTDCDDTNAAIFQSALLYTDADGDGYDAGSAVTCYGASVPTGYSLTTSGSDCNDADATKHATFAFYADADGDTYGAGTASNQCAVNATTPPAGYSVNNTDCDDTNAAIFQSALLYTDADGDGYDAGSAVTCYGASVPTGYSLTTSGSDCNDADATKHATFPFYADADGDTYGTGTASNQCAVDATTPPAGYSVNNTDCDDSNASVHATFPFYVDADGDTYGSGSVSIQCAVNGTTPPAGYSVNNTDCNDSNAAIYATFPFYTDADGDTYGAGVASNQCAVNATTPPAGFSVNNTDCNDSNAAVHASYSFYADNDADTYGAGALVPNVCALNATTAPAGYSVNNTDCNDNIAAINPGHAEVLYNGVDDNCNGQLDEGNQLKTKLLSSVCGTTLASIGSLIGITTVAQQPITKYRIKVVNGASVQIIERDAPHFTITELPTYDYATTYTVTIELQRNGIWLGYYGDPCLVSTPAVLSSNGSAQVSPSQCGVTLARMNTLIATTSIPNVTSYRFQVTNITPGASGPNVVQTIDRSLNWFSLTMLTQYNYQSTYRVEIAVKTTGAYSGFGSPCEINSPAAPTLVNCGGTVANANTLVAASSLAGVTQYRFQIKRVSDNATTTIDRSTNYFAFNMVPGYTPGVSYAVRVAVMTVGTWSPFGDACEITSPGTAARFVSQTDTMVSDVFKAVAYPNPFETAFAIDVTTSATASVQMKVYDMTGKLLESRDIKTSDLSTQSIGDRYSSGVYNIIVSQGSNVKTLRVIKR